MSAAISDSVSNFCDGNPTSTGCACYLAVQALDLEGALESYNESIEHVQNLNADLTQKYDEEFKAYSKSRGDVFQELNDRRENNHRSGWHSCCSWRTNCKNQCSDTTEYVEVNGTHGHGCTIVCKLTEAYKKEQMTAWDIRNPKPVEPKKIEYPSPFVEHVNLNCCENIIAQNDYANIKNIVQSCDEAIENKVRVDIDAKAEEDKKEDDQDDGEDNQDDGEDNQDDGEDDQKIGGNKKQTETVLFVALGGMGALLLVLLLLVVVAKQKTKKTTVKNKT